MDDLCCRVVEWVKRRNLELAEQSERVSNGLNHLGRALAAANTKLTDSGKEARRDDAAALRAACLPSRVRLPQRSSLTRSTLPGAPGGRDENLSDDFQ